MRSTPDSASARRAAIPPSTDGHPAGKRPTSAARPSPRAFSNATDPHTVAPLSFAAGPRVFATVGLADAHSSRSRLRLADAHSSRSQHAEPFAGGLHVLVAPAGETDQDRRVGSQLLRHPGGTGERVGTLDRRD